MAERSPELGEWRAETDRHEQLFVFLSVNIYLVMASLNTNVLSLLLCCFASCIGSRDGIGSEERAFSIFSAMTASLRSRATVALAVPNRPFGHVASAASNLRSDLVDSESDSNSKTNSDSEFRELPVSKIKEAEKLSSDRRSPFGNSYEFAAADKTYSLDVTNDGPVILGSSANFVATLKELSKSRHKEISSPTDLDSSSFFYVWRGDSVFLPQYLWNGSICKLTIPFDSMTGNLSVRVTVWATNKLLDKLAEATSAINVTETINGQILMRSTSYPECNTTDSQCSIPTKSNVSLIADIYDPTNYFETALIVYKWNMSNGHVITTTSPEQVYSYPVTGVYNVTLNVTAVMKEGAKKYGFWHKNITVLAPLTNLTIESCSTSVEVGKREVVNVTCNGSPPVEICITVQEPGVPINATNTTCVSISSAECFTTLSYHFHSSGEYVFQVAAQNNVSFLLNVSSIHAHPPPFPPQSITAITMAVLAGILMTSIGAIVFAQQVRRNRKQHVEVANFDFQFRDRSASIPRPRGFGWNWRPSKSIPLFNRTSSYYDSL